MSNVQITNVLYTISYERSFHLLFNISSLPLSLECSYFVSKIFSCLIHAPMKNLEDVRGFPCNYKWLYSYRRLCLRVRR